MSVSRHAWLARRGHPDLSGKAVLITGANSGIGLRGGTRARARGASVMLGCRDPAKGEAAVARIRAETPAQARVARARPRQPWPRCAAQPRALPTPTPRLDVLCNNAGVMAIPRTLTADGFEMQFGGEPPRPLRAHRAAARAAAGRGRARDRDRQQQRAPHRPHALRRPRRRAPLLQVERVRPEQAREPAVQRSSSSGGCRRGARRAISVACHPGYAATNLQFVGPALEGSTRRRRRSSAWPTAVRAVRGEGRVAHALRRDRSPTCRAATTSVPAARPSSLARPRRWQPTARPTTSTVARQLWEVSIERTGVYDY